MSNIFCWSQVYRNDVSNRTIDINFPYFPVMPYGRYLFTLAVFAGRENIGLLVADVEAVPKV